MVQIFGNVVVEILQISASSSKQRPSSCRVALMGASSVIKNLGAGEGECESRRKTIKQADSKLQVDSARTDEHVKTQLARNGKADAVPYEV